MSAGNLTLNTPVLTNSGMVAAGVVNSGSVLTNTISGGTLTLNGGSGLTLSGQGGTLTGTNGISLTAGTGNLYISGTQTLKGAATFTANSTGSYVNIAAGSVLSGASSITFATSNPQHGTLSGTAPNLTYTPAPNYNGADSFTFTVSVMTAGGPVTSAPAPSRPFRICTTMSTRSDPPLVR